MTKTKKAAGTKTQSTPESTVLDEIQKTVETIYSRSFVDQETGRNIYAVTAYGKGVYFRGFYPASLLPAKPELTPKQLMTVMLKIAGLKRGSLKFGVCPSCGVAVATFSQMGKPGVNPPSDPAKHKCGRCVADEKAVLENEKLVAEVLA